MLLIQFNFYCNSELFYVRIPVTRIYFFHFFFTFYKHTSRYNCTPIFHITLRYLAVNLKSKEKNST